MNDEETSFWQELLSGLIPIIVIALVAAINVGGYLLITNLFGG